MAPRKAGAIMRWSVPREVHGDGRFLLRRRGFVPAYLKAHEEGRLRDKVEEALSHLGPSCRVCPRLCQGVDRRANQFGVCRVGRHARVASAFPHFGEEDVLRGWKGSGTIFFSLCNLRCVFCQNGDISQAPVGEELDARGLACVMLRLQEKGCHNINFVTPEHVVPQIVEALQHAVELGLRLPLVYNTSSYDSLDSLRVMDGLVDVYMPDFKLWDEAASREYLAAVNYPRVARDVVREMYRQVGDLRADEDGLALRGVLVRHLVMPGRLDDTGPIIGWLADLSRDCYLNLMDQYHPAWKVTTNPRFTAINRRVTRGEMARAEDLARSAGLWRLDERWRKLSPLDSLLAVLEE
jgi:putative pyruvate formate lyase activating enzyme